MRNCLVAISKSIPDPILFKLASPFFKIRQDLPQQAPEFRRVVIVEEMAKLMCSDVVDQRHRGHDDPPVEAKLFLFIATAPSLLLIADKGSGSGNAQLSGVDSGSLGKSGFCMLFEPVNEKLPGRLFSLRHRPPFGHVHEERACLEAYLGSDVRTSDDPHLEAILTT